MVGDRVGRRGHATIGALTRVSVGRGRVGGHDGEYRWRLDRNVEEFNLVVRKRVNVGRKRWEGMHHDFSDGNQHVDLFDGFFFGGQQAGSGGGL